MQQIPDLLLGAELRAIKASNSDLKKQIQHWQNAFDESEKRLGIVLDIKGRAAKPIKPIIPTKGRASESTAIMVASDWHSEETVDPSTVNGLNEFNLQIADARIKNFFVNGLKLINIQRAATDIDTLVLPLLGDFINGYLRPENLEDNSASPTEATLWVIERIKSGIDYLKKNGGLKRIVIPTASGNHGRTNEKPRISSAYKNSFEWMMYHILAQNISGVEWMVLNGIHTYVDVYGKTIRFHHGDAIKYGGGIGGITIPVNKAIAGWDRSKRADCDIFGHFHSYQINRKFIANGSLVGYSPFSQFIKAEYEPPTQAFVLIEKKYGFTVQCPIYV